MLYTTEILDRATGDLKEIELGDWITVTELGQRYGVGPNRVRAILHHMGLLWPEGGRFRITPLAVTRGLGKRIDRPKRSKWPFDVISPLGQRLVAEAWDDTVADMEHERVADSGVSEATASLAWFRARRAPAEIPTQVAVCWLLDLFPRLTHEQIAAVLDVTRPLVGRYAGQRARQLDYLRRLVERTLQGTWKARAERPAVGAPKHPICLVDLERPPVGPA